MTSNSYLIITNLPSEAWRLFSRFLGPLELSRLCQSSPRLNVLICHPNGCDSLHVDFGLSRHIPTLAFRLAGLRSLDLTMDLWYISHDEQNSIHDFQISVLERLPKSLTRLRVHASNAFFPFFKIGRNYRGQLDFLPSVETGISQDSVVDIREILPNLRELDVFGNCPQTHFIPRLPDTVTSLKVRKFTGSSLAPLTKFPLHLVNLDIQIPDKLFERPTFVMALSRLSSLERLVISDLKFYLDDNIMQFLPSSLTYLECGTDWDLSTSIASARLINLKSLHILPLHLSADSFFPDSLAHLTLGGNLIHFPFQVLLRLPRGLLRLRVWSLSSEWDFSLLPRGLRSLEIPIWHSAAMGLPEDEKGILEFMKGLPPSLTNFEFIKSFGKDHFPLELLSRVLPSTLTSTDLIYYCSHTTEKDLQSTLPSLTKLKGSVPYRLLVNTPFKCFRSLPQHLKTLDISCMVDRSENPTEAENLRIGWTVLDTLIPLLPSTLTELSVRDSRFVSDSCLLGLPSRLRKLSITHFYRKTCRMSFTTSGLKSLPPHLTYLELVLNAQVDTSFFGYLPAGLSDLYLNGLEKVEDSDISILPRAILNLHLTPAQGLTDNCIPLLPPMIRYLSLPKVNTFTTSMIPLVPRFLCTIDIRNCRNFPRSIRKVLPKRLAMKTKIWATF